jgi:HEAT repeat protein
VRSRSDSRSGRAARRGSRLGLAAIALAALGAVLAAPRCDGSANGVEPPAPAQDVPADSAAADVLAAARGAAPLLCDLVALVLDGRYGWHDDAPEPSVGRSEDPRIRAALTWTREPEGAGDVAAVRSALGDADACVRRTAARLLGRSGDARALDALREALAAPDPASREAGALGLGIAEDESTLRDLLPVLRDDEVAVRVAAAWALGRIEDPAAIEPLVARLQDDREPRVRAAAAWALGEIE